MKANSKIYDSFIDFFLDYPLFVILTAAMLVIFGVFIYVLLMNARIRREDIRVNARVTSITSSASGGKQSFYVNLSAVYNDEQIFTTMSGVSASQIGSLHEGNMTEVLINRKRPAYALPVDRKESGGMIKTAILLLIITLIMTAICVLLYMGINVFLLV